METTICHNVRNGQQVVVHLHKEMNIKNGGNFPEAEKWVKLKHGILSEKKKNI